MPEARDPQHNDPGIDLLYHVLADTPPFEGPGAVIFHHHVGGLAEFLENFGTFGFPQIQGDASFVAGDRFPPQRNTFFSDRFQFSLAIAVFGMFELDDIGPEIRQQDRRKRRRDHIPGIDDAHALEWLVVAFAGQGECVRFIIARHSGDLSEAKFLMLMVDQRHCGVCSPVVVILHEPD